MPTMRIVAHIDMDAFDAVVEERDTPRFRGPPLAVGADPEGGKGRGVVSTANYKARECRIHSSAMPISTVWRLSEAARRQGKPAHLEGGTAEPAYARATLTPGFGWDFRPGERRGIVIEHQSVFSGGDRRPLFQRPPRDNPEPF